MPDNKNIGAPGADSSAEVLHQIGGKTLLDRARDLFGDDPRFWGRYFKTPSDFGGVQYNPNHEHAVLAQRKIRVAPIARQTGNVHGTQADGARDARGNVDAIFAAFGADYLRSQGGQFFVYLDVEGDPNPSLSASYWIGWALTLRAYSRQSSQDGVTLLPGLYCNLDHATWIALAQAQQTAPCSSVWLARWVADPPTCVVPPPWNPAHVQPSPAPNCPVHAWQYAAECGGGDGIDTNEANPGLDLDAFLGKLILPPA